MAWIFVSKAKMNYFVNGDSSTVIKNAILDSLVLQSDALDSWNQSSMNINISTDKVISYGNIVARRNGIVQTRASSNGAVSYGVDGAFWMHFYNEGNNWYYRAFTGTVSGSEYIDYTQLTQSYDIAIYSGFAINESLHRAALLTLTVNESNNSKIELNAYFKRPSISFDDFYTEIKSVILTFTSNGGGATHIAKVTGQLKDLSSNLSDILMVSGGGGGGLLVGDTDYSGKEAGGISGSGDNSADQSTGNAFGQGESGTNASGGGGGLYGGYKGTSSKSGGAGSGYIGNSLVSNKKMVGYNVPISSAEGTKTESVEVYDSNYVANKPKAGNGHARIKFLRDILIRVLVDSSTEYLDSNLTETRMVEQGPGYTKGGGGGFSQGLFGIGSNYGAQVGFGYVTDLIDFSLYSKIKLIDFRYTSANNNSFKIALVRDEPIWKIQNQSPWASLNKITDFTATNKSSSQDYVFDISSITESGYLIFGCPNMEIENSFSVEFQKLELIE